MDVTKAHGIVSALANGVNPTTGEVFPSDSPYQSPAIIRALFIASRVLEGALPAAPLAAKPEPAPAAKPNTSNVGKPWSPEDDQRLLSEFDAGRTASELARLLGRTLAGIEARLEKHGRITPEQRSTNNRYRPENGARANPAS